MKIKLPRLFRRRPTTEAEWLRSTPLAVLEFTNAGVEAGEQFRRAFLNRWTTVVEPQPVKERCIGCRAMVTVETDGQTRRLAAHPIGNHHHVPLCSASGAAAGQ